MDKKEYLKNFCREAAQKKFSTYKDEANALDLRSKVLFYLSSADHSEQAENFWINKVFAYRTSHNKYISTAQDALVIGKKGQ